jgi:hypothetical protein
MKHSSKNTSIAKQKHTATHLAKRTRKIAAKQPDKIEQEMRMSM